MSNTFTQTTLLSFSDTNGDVQGLNVGKGDNGITIFYELETQELEFGNRSHLKKISDKIGTLNNFDSNSSLQGKSNDNDYQSIPMNMSDRVNIGKSINLEGNWFMFKWSGDTSTNSPIFDGLYVESIEDLGIQK